MTYTILVLVVFLLNGEPQAYAVTLSPDASCNTAQAVTFAHQVEVQLNQEIQEEVLWQCMPVRSPGPATTPDAPPRSPYKGDEA